MLMVERGILVGGAPAVLYRIRDQAHHAAGRGLWQDSWTKSVAVVVKPDPGMSWWLRTPPLARQPCAQGVEKRSSYRLPRRDMVVACWCGLVVKLLVALWLF